MGLSLKGLSQMEYRKFLKEPVALDQINSDYDEMNPVLAPDGKTLYFTRALHPENAGGATGGQDVWKATLSMNGEWSEPVRLNENINTVGHNAVCGISRDGNRLYLANAYKDEYLQPGISVSTKQNGEWTKPEPIDIDLEIPKGSFFGFCISDSEDVIVMSYKPSANEKEDLFVSEKRMGSWSKPQPLGNNVNSDGYEFAPSFVGDTMLYFSSNRDPGFGESDVFMTRKVGNSWTQWEEPENIAHPFNSKNFDAYFTRFGNKIIFVSNREGQEKGDLYLSMLDSVAIEKPEKEPTIITIKDDEFKNVLFGFDRSFIREDMKPVLSNVIEYLEGNPEVEVILNGHTDYIDTQEYNLALSKRRTESVKEYLINEGIKEDRISMNWYGEKRPIVTNQTAWGRQKNRRVDFDFTKELARK